jgi:Protein of unknown function (DUF3293)
MMPSIERWADAHTNLSSRQGGVRTRMWPQGGKHAGVASALPERRAFLLFESIIDADTVQTFRETEYRVLGDEPFTLKVGEVCPGLAAVHKRYRVDCSAYITACNPFSQIIDDDANAERHVALDQELGRRSLASIAGIGQHPTNQWPDEPSYLVFGLTLVAAKTLGTRLEQNAIVWTGTDAVPQLILLR